MSDVVLNSTLADDFTSIHLTVWMYGSPKSNKRATCAIHVCTSLPSVHDSTRHAAQHGTCIYTVLHWEGSRRQEATNRGGYREPVSSPLQVMYDHNVNSVCRFESYSIHVHGYMCWIALSGVAPEARVLQVVTPMTGGGGGGRGGAGRGC